MYFNLQGKRRDSRRGAFTVVELMVASGIFMISGLAIMTLFNFGARGFASMANYAILDKVNRQAMDKLTQEIRQSVEVDNVTTNPAALNLLNGDGLSVTYTFDPSRRQMTRTASDGSSQILLTNCTLLNFNVYQRNTITNSFDVFPVATSNWVRDVKLIELTWKTSMTVSPTANVQSENVQTARIVIRKQRS